jgi:hypothetical protein
MRVAAGGAGALRKIGDSSCASKRLVQISTRQLHSAGPIGFGLGLGFTMGRTAGPPRGCARRQCARCPTLARGKRNQTRTSFARGRPDQSGTGLTFVVLSCPDVEHLCGKSGVFCRRRRGLCEARPPCWSERDRTGAAVWTGDAALHRVRSKQLSASEQVGPRVRLRLAPAASRRNSRRSRTGSNGSDSCR